MTKKKEPWIAPKQSYKERMDAVYNITQKINLICHELQTNVDLNPSHRVGLDVQLMNFNYMLRSLAEQMKDK